MQHDELDLLLDGADRWFADHSPMTERVAHFRAGHHEAPGAWSALAELGWTALTLPESAGGFAARHTEAFALLRRAGRDARPEPLGLHLLLAPRVAAQRPASADELASGSMRLALADAAQHLHLTAGAVPVLGGQAGTLLGAEGATHYLLPVQHGAQQLMVMVDAAASGISQQPARLVDGRSTQQLAFDHTPILVVLGDAQSWLDLAAASLVADSAGVLDAAFELTLDYLKQRQQFGKPLSVNQAIQHRMAEVFCDLQQLIALSGRLAAEIDTAPDGPWPTLAPAKAFVGRRALRAAGALIQLSGGIAVTEEYRLTHFYRRLQVAATLFGDAEQQLARIDVATQLLAA